MGRLVGVLGEISDSSTIQVPGRLPPADLPSRKAAGVTGQSRGTEHSRPDLGRCPLCQGCCSVRRLARLSAPAGRSGYTTEQPPCGAREGPWVCTDAQASGTQRSLLCVSWCRSQL